MHSKRFLHQIDKFTSCNTFINGDVRYILEARKRALAKKKKLRSLGKRAQSADSEDEMEVDGESDIRAHICHEYHELYSWRKNLPRGDWRNFSFLYWIWTIYGVLSKFRPFLFQIYVEKICVEQNDKYEVCQTYISKFKFIGHLQKICQGFMRISFTFCKRQSFTSCENSPRVVNFPLWCPPLTKEYNEI